jgi:RNA polymerase sigma-70 factor (ECF subfamily)
VFVLREVFGYGHREIAALLDRTEAAVRQIAHRAREHVRAGRGSAPIRRRPIAWSGSSCAPRTPATCRRC